MLGDHTLSLSSHKKLLLVSRPKTLEQFAFHTHTRNSAIVLGSSASGHSFPWCSYILGIVTNFPRNSFLIGPLALMSFYNGIQQCEKKSFLWKSNAWPDLWGRRGRLFSEKRFQRAVGKELVVFAVCVSPLKLCGGCQKADRWRWGKQEGQGAVSSLYHIKHWAIYNSRGTFRIQRCQTADPSKYHLPRQILRAGLRLP